MAIAPIGPAGWGLPAEGARSTQSPAVPSTFGRVMDQWLGQANVAQVQADKAVQDLALGNTDSLHGVMLAVAKADLSFRMVLEIRNRLAEAFQEVMRMQV